MPGWQERIDRETSPAIVAEHLLRYRLVSPLVDSSAAWADLGCGNGIAQAAALGAPVRARAVLVDLEPEAVARAAAELGVGESAVQVAGDLTEPAVLARIERELMAAQGERIVTCFEVLEHLSAFLPLLEWSGELARAGAATFVLSVPNDAFWSIENPYHAGRWGEGAFEELRRLLPRERTLLRQVSLSGSAVAEWEAPAERRDLAVEVPGAGETVPTHFLAAFGPRHGALRTGALAVASDQLAQRRWERQRESNLAFAQARVEELDSERARWREYIHELERALGRPLSGVRSEAPGSTGE